MKKWLYLFVVFFCNVAFAQRESYSWIYGNCDSTLNNCEGVYGTAIIKFNVDSIESIRRVNFPIPFSFLSSCISDSAGNMVLATSNNFVFDSLGNVILDLATNDYLNYQLGYLRYSALFFKLKEPNNIYYFINFKVAWIDSAENPLMNNRISRIYLSKIKVDETGYQVLKVDTLLRNDTILGSGIHACRHANGRDWWIFKTTYSQKKFLRGLLTPYGLNFETLDGPGPDLFKNSGRLQFSSDGTKLFHYITTSFRKMQIYDFDRCTGELSNFREIDFSPFIPHPPYDFNPFVLSPDGSKIYMGRSNPTDVVSYQTIQVDVESGQMTVVADTTFVPCLTPNLKWIVSGHQTIPWLQIDKLSVITNPNNIGNECGLIKDLYDLSVDGFILEPIEYANHLLGPIDGSSCDTLGLDQDYTWLPKVPEVSFVIYPNPGQSELNFRTDMPLPINLTITDAQGKLVLQQQFNKSSFTLSNEIAALQQGIYFVELRNNEKGIRASKKWMKIP